jgi:hypothetical protein
MALSVSWWNRWHLRRGVSVGTVSLRLCLCALLSACSAAYRGGVSHSDVTLFISPYCSVFQNAMSRMRPIEFEDRIESTGGRVWWRPVNLMGTPCEREAAKYILCAERVDKVARVVEILATEDIGERTCTPEVLAEFLQVPELDGERLGECVSGDGEALFDENARIVADWGVRGVPFYAQGSDAAVPFFSLPKLADRLAPLNE